MSQIKFVYLKQFDSKLRKAPLKIKKAFNEAQNLYVINPDNKILNVHRLKGKYKGCKSLNIDYDWRAIFIERKKTIVFLEIGTHSDLYE